MRGQGETEQRLAGHELVEYLKVLFALISRGLVGIPLVTEARF